MKEITVVELNKISDYPPVQNLIKVLLGKGYKVNFIGNSIDEIAEKIKDNALYNGFDVALYHKKMSKFEKVINLIHTDRMAKKYLKSCMQSSEVLWITSARGISGIGKKVLKYKSILQFMELAEKGYYFKNYIEIPIRKYAASAWKTVVPEINRAYILKVWWNLEKTPCVLPNKPYSIECGEATSELEKAISIMQSEKRKIVLYLGGIFGDRDYESCAKSISKMNDYALYIVGNANSKNAKDLLSKLTEEYNAVYLGGFNPPTHLSLVKYARIGLLPYKPSKGAGLSELNALYCAPNKIWEYAGFGVPMVGSDVLGLKLPFEQWNIGRCCDLNDESSIIEAIEEVDRNHDEMSRNCYKFYDSVDLEKIVSEILEDENYSQHDLKPAKISGGGVKPYNRYVLRLRVGGAA